MAWRNIHRTARVQTKTKPSTKSVSGVLSIHIISCETSSRFDITAAMTSWGWTVASLSFMSSVLCSEWPLRCLLEIQFWKHLTWDLPGQAQLYILCVFISVLAQSLPTLSRMTEPREWSYAENPQSPSYKQHTVDPEQKHLSQAQRQAACNSVP